MDSSSSLTRVSYWDNILLSHKAEKIIPDDILQKFCTYINNGEYQTLDLDEKYRITIDGVHWVVRSARLSDAKRVLFTDQGPNLIILDYLPNHEYSKSAVMESQWFRQFVSSRLGRHQRPEDFIQVVMEPLPIAPSMAIPRGAVYSYNHVDFNFLDPQQSQLPVSLFPRTTIGLPGTGKTLASRELLYQRIERHLEGDTPTEILQLAYFTNAQRLAETEKNIAAQQSFADSPWVSIDYWHDELRYPTGLTAYWESLLAWATQKIASTPLLETLSAEQLLREFDLLFVLERIAGPTEFSNLYTHPRKGFAQQSLFPDKARQLPEVLRLFREFHETFFENPRQPYVQGFRSALPTDKIYSVATYDESQNATLSEVYEAFVLCQGRLSILYDPKQAQSGQGRDIVSLFENIVHQLRPFGCTFQPRLELQQNYRCGLKQLELCNQLLRLRAWALKGVTIKDEAPLITLPIQDHANGSRVFWYNSFEDTHYQTEVLPHLSKDSADWATITDPSYFSEVRTYIGEEPILMGYQQIPGVEFKVTQIYHPINPDLLTPELLVLLDLALDPTTPLPASLAKLENRTKYAELLKWIGQIFTAITRSMHTTIIIQPDVQLRHKKVFRKLVQLLALPQSLDRTQKMLISLTGSSIARWQEVVLGLRDDPVLAQNLYDRHLAQETGLTFTEWMQFVSPPPEDTRASSAPNSRDSSPTTTCADLSSTSSSPDHTRQKPSNTIGKKNVSYSKLSRQVGTICQPKNRTEIPKLLSNCSTAEMIDILFTDSLEPIPLKGAAQPLTVAANERHAKISLFGVCLQSAEKHSQTALRKLSKFFEYSKAEEILMSDDFLTRAAPENLVYKLQEYWPTQSHDSLFTLSIFEALAALAACSEQAHLFFQKIFVPDSSKRISQRAQEALTKHYISLTKTSSCHLLESMREMPLYPTWQIFVRNQCPSLAQLHAKESASTDPEATDIGKTKFIKVGEFDVEVLDSSDINDLVPIERTNTLLTATQALFTTLRQKLRPTKEEFIKAVKDSQPNILTSKEFLQLLLNMTLEDNPETISDWTPFSEPSSPSIFISDDIVMRFLSLIEAENGIAADGSLIHIPKSIGRGLITHYGTRLLALLSAPSSTENSRSIILSRCILTMCINLDMSLDKWFSCDEASIAILKTLIQDKPSKGLVSSLLSKLCLVRSPAVQSPLQKILAAEQAAARKDGTVSSSEIVASSTLSLVSTAIKNQNLSAAETLLSQGAAAYFLHCTEGSAISQAIETNAPEVFIEKIFESLKKQNPVKALHYFSYRLGNNFNSVLGLILKKFSNNSAAKLKLSPFYQSIVGYLITIGVDFSECIDNESSSRAYEYLLRSEHGVLISAMLQSLRTHILVNQEVSKNIFEEPKTIGARLNHPLLTALDQGYWTAAEELVKAGCALFYVSPVHGMTALMLATEAKDPSQNLSMKIAQQLSKKLAKKRISPSYCLAYLNLEATINGKVVSAIEQGIRNGHAEFIYLVLSELKYPLRADLFLMVMESKNNLLIANLLLSALEEQVENGTITTQQKITYLHAHTPNHPEDSVVVRAVRTGSVKAVERLLKMGLQNLDHVLWQVLSIKHDEMFLLVLKHIESLSPEIQTHYVNQLDTKNDPSSHPFVYCIATQQYVFAAKLLPLGIAKEYISVCFSSVLIEYTLKAPKYLFDQILSLSSRGQGDTRQDYPDQYDWNGTTVSAVELAIHLGASKNAISLVKAGADVFSPTANGDTLLILACFYKQWDVALCILSTIAESGLSDKEKAQYVHRLSKSTSSLYLMSALSVSLQAPYICDAIFKISSALFCSAPEDNIHQYALSLLVLAIRSESNFETIFNILKALKEHDFLSSVINQAMEIEVIPGSGLPAISATPVLMAIIKSNPLALNLLLSFHACPITAPPLSDMTTIMHAAIYSRDTQTMDDLLIAIKQRCPSDFERYLNHVSTKGYTALTYTITHKKEELALTLIKHGANAFLETSLHDPMFNLPVLTAFEASIIDGSLPLIKSILSTVSPSELPSILSKPFFLEKTGKKLPAFLQAQELGHSILSDYLLKRCPELVSWNCTEKHGFSLLLSATRFKESNRVASTLAKISACPDPSFNKQAYIDMRQTHPAFFGLELSALGFALLQNQMTSAEYLILANASLDTIAVKRDHLEYTAFEMLHSDMTEPDLYRKALESQTEAKRKKLLLTRIRPVDTSQLLSRSISGSHSSTSALEELEEPPLAYFLRSAHPKAEELCRTLLELGASPFSEGYDEKSVLFLAAELNNIKILSLIIEYVAKSTERTPTGKMNYMNERLVFKHEENGIRSIECLSVLTFIKRANPAFDIKGFLAPMITVEDQALAESITIGSNGELKILNEWPLPLLHAILTKNNSLALQLIDQIRQLPAQARASLLAACHSLSRFEGTTKSFLALAIEYGLEDVACALIDLEPPLANIQTDFKNNSFSCFELLCFRTPPHHSLQTRAFEKALLLLIAQNNLHILESSKIFSKYPEPFIIGCLAHRELEPYVRIMLQYKIGTWSKGQSGQNLLFLALRYDFSLSTIELILQNILEDTTYSASEKIDYLKSQTLLSGIFYTAYQLALNKQSLSAEKILSAISTLEVESACNPPAPLLMRSQSSVGTRNPMDSSISLQYQNPLLHSKEGATATTTTNTTSMRRKKKPEALSTS